MHRLKTFRVFLEVARCGSFQGAATNLGMSRAAVTKHIAQLEHSFGVRLLNRTTREVGLTHAGMLALEPCRQMLSQYDALQTDLRDSITAPSGVIRVGTPPAFGSAHMVPLVRRFTAMHPDISVVLVLDVGDVSLIQKGLDLSIRISVDLPDSSHIAVPIGSAPQALVAAPAYLDAHGRPQAPDELADHNCLAHTIKSPTGMWRLDGPTGRHMVRVQGTLAADFGEVLRMAALSGEGIAMHPYYMVQQDLDQGRLELVLPQYLPEAHVIHVLYSSRSGLPERARRFVDFLREWFRSPARWSQVVPFGQRGGV